MISQKAVEHLRAATFLKNFKAVSDHEAISRMLGVLQGRPEVRDWQQLSAAVFDRQQTDPPLFPGGVSPLPESGSVVLRSYLDGRSDPVIELERQLITRR